MEDLNSLRRFGFPKSARLGVEKLESILSPADSGIPGLGDAGEEIAERLVTEFVFCQMPNRSGYVKKLSALQELQVLEILLEFFKKLKNDFIKNAAFKVLFEKASQDSVRLEILSKLASMAVGIGCPSIMHSLAVWMQRQGCNSETVCHVGEYIVMDYCKLVQGSCQVLKALPSKSLLFTCNLLTTLTSIYRPPGRRKNSHKPELPPELLQVATEWISEYPELCLTSLNQSNSRMVSDDNSLWTSPSKPNTQTPIPGLVRWCTQAPLSQALAAKNSSLADSSEVRKTNIDHAELNKVWSKLHLGVLKTLITFPTMSGAPQMELITLADMNRIVKELMYSLKELDEPIENPLVNMAVERLLQTLQVALATGGFRCSLVVKEKIRSVDYSRMESQAL